MRIGSRLIAAIGIVACLSPTAFAQMLTIGSAVGRTAVRLPFTVRYSTTGSAAAGLQFDLVYDDVAPIATTTNGLPDCTVDPSSNKQQTTFTFTNPTTTHIVVTSSTNNLAIPNGQTLFTCYAKAPSGTPAGMYQMAVRNPSGTAPDGSALAFVAYDDDGVVDVIPTVSAGLYYVNRGSSVQVPVNLNGSGGAGTSIVATRVDLSMSAATPIVRNSNGTPSCSGAMSGYGFTFQPTGCAYPSGCTSVSALWTSADLTPIGDGALFNCTYQVPTTTVPGTYPLTLSPNVVVKSMRVGASTPRIPAYPFNGALVVQ